MYILYITVHSIYNCNMAQMSERMTELMCMVYAYTIMYIVCMLYKVVVLLLN